MGAKNTSLEAVGCTSIKPKMFRGLPLEVVRLILQNLNPINSSGDLMSTLVAQPQNCQLMRDMISRIDQVDIAIFEALHVNNQWRDLMLDVLCEGQGRRTTKQMHTHQDERLEWLHEIEVHFRALHEWQQHQNKEDADPVMFIDDDPKDVSRRMLFGLDARRRTRSTSDFVRLGKEPCDGVVVWQDKSHDAQEHP